LELIDAAALVDGDHISLRWSPLRWLERRIYVDELRLQRLQMERAPWAMERAAAGTIPISTWGNLDGRRRTGRAAGGKPATVSCGGNWKLRSLQNADADVWARRLTGRVNTPCT